MIKEDKSLKFFAPLFITMVMIGFVIVGAKNLLGNADYYFLYNRARQLLTCIQDGQSLGFFYNDFNGVGYGSSFFYGYLTLIPFLPLLNYGGLVFLNAYLIVAGLLFSFGTLYLVSRFTDKYIWITCLYLLSTFVLEMFSTTGLAVNFFAVGLSFFFIGCCIDFFRDRKKFIWASILFFLILNTHLITALLSFIICCVVMVCYFEKDRIKEYGLFGFITLIFCSHFIITFMCHLNMPMFLENTSQWFLTNTSENNAFHTGFFGSPFIFCDVITLLLIRATQVDGYSIFGLGFLIVSLFILGKYYKSFTKKEVLCLVSFVLGVWLGLVFVWKGLLSICNIPIQFPMRYMFYLLLGFYIIVCKRITKKSVIIALFIISVPNLFFRLFVNGSNLSMTTLAELYNNQVMNGEYLSTDFKFDMDSFEQHRNEVVDEQGTQYTFVKDKNKLYVKYLTDKKHNLIIPKLYYKGYVCVNTETGQTLPVYKGVSQFIEIQIPENSAGIYEIYYDDLFYMSWQYISYVLIVIISGFFLFTNFEHFDIKFARKS